MKTPFWLLAFSSFLAVSALAQDQETSRLEISERGDNHRVWQRITAEVDAAGTTTYRTNAAYTELETGMHVKQRDGSFIEASDEIEITGNGAIAQKTRHQVAFAGNCNSPVAIDMVSADGKRFQSKILGISYFDSATGRSVLIAEIKDSDGQLLLDSKNEVIYLDAFTDFKADVLYKNSKSGLEQNIIFRANPPSPADYHLNPATTRLQVLTEFFNPPVPEKGPQLIDGVADEFLDFGDQHMGRGWLYVTGSDRTKIPVTKQWSTLNERTFLIEEIPYRSVEAQLKALPPRTASLNTSPDGVRHQVSVRRLLPPIMLAVKTSSSIKLASAPLKGQGVVLDYSLVSGGTSYVFKGDSTYYVNGETKFTGEVTIEGGTVIKFSSTNYSALWVDGGSVTCQTSPYRPAIFTSRNDNTAGETIAGSTGLPAIDTQGNYYLMISSTNQTTLQYLRMSYCYCGLTAIGGSLNLSHVQFVHSDYPVYIVSTTQCSVRNALMEDVTQLAFEVASALVTVEHLTVDRCSQLGGNDGGATMTLTNSLLVGVSSMGNIPCTSNTVVTLGTNVTVFQTVGAAGHYLADNTYRSAGTTTINASLAADLKKLTTYPPIELTSNFTVDTTLSPQAQRDTDTPDLGYHYDPIDYVWAGLILTNATLQLTNGVVVSTLPGSNINSAMLYVKSNGKLTSEGSPTQLNRLVRYNTVQERAVTNLINNAYCVNVDSLAATEIRCRFTDWSACSGSGNHLIAYFNTIQFTDCRLSGSGVYLKGCNVGLTNCLFERVIVDLKDDGIDTVGRFLYNNLLRGGQLWLVRDGLGVSQVRDNLFDQTTNTQSGTITHDHNGYISGYPRWTPTNANDVVLTNIPVYLTNWLGKYYYPTNDGMLSLLLDVGSRYATNAGLYHYTVTTNQVKEMNSTVDIGFHYVATDTNGVPIDTDGDGLADYFEDRNGNGVFDTGDVADFNLSDTDGDGVSDYLEYLQGRNPLSAGAVNDTNGVVKLRVYTPLK